MLREAEVVRARKGVCGGMRGARAKRCAGSVALAKPGRLHPGHRQRVRCGAEIKLPEGSRGEHGMHVFPLPIILKLCLWAPCLVFSLFMGALCSCEERCAAGCRHWRCPRWEARFRLQPAVCAAAAATAREVPRWDPRCPRALSALRGSLGVCPSSCFRCTGPPGVL